MKIDDEDARILIKDQLFLVYGKIIRKQVREEKKNRKQRPKKKRTEISAPRQKK